MNRQKCKFSFFQVRCAHKSGDVVNITTVVWYKNYKNRLRLAKVIVKNILPRFFLVHCVYSAWLFIRTQLRRSGIHRPKFMVRVMVQVRVRVDASRDCAAAGDLW